MRFLSGQCASVEHAVGAEAAQSAALMPTMGGGDGAVGDACRRAAAAGPLSRKHAILLTNECTAAVCGSRCAGAGVWPPHALRHLWTRRTPPDKHHA